MKKENNFFVKTLKEQVYEYLRDKIQSGEIKPGETINLERTSSLLGISRTPLRDALLQLEFEGFVTIKPRKGIIVNSLSFDDIKKIYQIIGALESSCIISVKDKIGERETKILESLNQKMKKAVKKGDFDTYYNYNLDFHNLFINLCENEDLKEIVDIKKRRLYDFQRKRGILKDWEENSVKEHQRIIDFIKEGDFVSAANYMRDVHWAYQVQEKFVKKYYSFHNG